jgi:hypothetical protein
MTAPADSLSFSDAVFFATVSIRQNSISPGVRMASMMQFPDFSNKIILVYLMGRPPDDGVLLQHAVFEIQGGRPFIIGEFAEGASANDWVAGVCTALAWDTVQQYFVFDSMEDYMARASQAYHAEQFH